MTDFSRYLNIRSATSPVPSNDGRYVAFLTDTTGNFQAWSMGLSGAAGRGVNGSVDEEHLWPRQLTFFSDKVWELHGSPMHDQLIATSDVGGNERQQFYLISNFGCGTNGRAQHDVRRLTTTDQAIHRFGGWSKDGTQISYTSNARNSVDFDPYVMDVASGESHMICESSGNRALVAWSPDAKTLLMLEALASEQNELYLLDIESGRERHLTANQPQARYGALKWTKSGLYTITDREHDTFAICQLDLETGALEAIVSADTLLQNNPHRRGELSSFTISSDGHRAIFTLNVEGYNNLYLLDLADRTWEWVEDAPRGLIGGFKFSSTGDEIVFECQSPTRNPDIWTYNRSSRRFLQRTFSNRAGIDAETFVAPSIVNFLTFDGREIPAYLYIPHSPPPPDGYPCILYVHGGPAGQQRPDFDVRFQYFLSQGYALMVPNVRGSTGYGREYMMSDDLELRMDSVTDLKYAVEWLQQHTDINRSAIAIYGRSYGGYMVLAALTEYPELFAAGIDVVGISNWVSFMERTSSWRRSHRAREYGSLEKHRDLLERISPIHKADRIACPLLVLAGDNDPRVPLSESEQIVERVRAAGGSVDFIHYADEGHRFSKLSNRIDSFTKMAEFLKSHLAS